MSLTSDGVVKRWVV